MRRKWLCLAVLVGLLLPAAPAMAASDLLFGQEHYYSVTMRGNGEAVVTARLVFTNAGDTPQTSFKFEIPDLKVQDLVGYQQFLKPTCVSYGAGAKPTVAPDDTTTVVPCLKYSEPDYSQTYSYGGNSTYKKLTFKSEGGGKYAVELPTAVAAQESTALLMS